MGCRYNSDQWCNLACAGIGRIGEEYDPSDEFSCDSDGTCHHHTNEQSKQCEGYESDEYWKKYSVLCVGVM